MKMSESNYLIGDVLYIESENAFHVVQQIIKMPSGIHKIPDEILVRTMILGFDEKQEPRLFGLPAGSTELINQRWLLENSTKITD